MDKYDVYVVIIEASEEDHIRLADSVDQLQTVGSDLSWQEAEDLQADLYAAAMGS